LRLNDANYFAALKSNIPENGDFFQERYSTGNITD
jgi:hypothetical protein